jgi:hypothetical protein
VGHWQTSPSTHDWKTIWLIPGGISVVVMVFFLLFFTDKNHTELKPGLDIEEPSPAVEI